VGEGHPYGLEDPVFRYGEGEGIFPLPEMSGEAVGSTRPPAELGGGGWIMSSRFWEMIKFVV